jgi:hypothetical protein
VVELLLNPLAKTFSSPHIKWLDSFAMLATKNVDTRAFGKAFGFLASVDQVVLVSVHQRDWLAPLDLNLHGVPP